MLAVRLQRAGSKKRPFFRIVVIESTAARDSRFLENVGHYDPRSQPEKVRLDYGRLAHWRERGAQLSDTVRTLVARHPAPPEPAAATEEQSPS